ncbi:hypothetical protein [Streptomyces sp. EN23]|uniref:hypothetical protein n=1 Tax=Streptomyces sp. EN23 TaxID=212774 RepID=UPI000851F428|nr:hypothetical protein [Streptomyces sp. EN23]
MAARTSKDSAGQPEETPAATVRTQEYAAGTGWDVGQTAPKDAFRALGGEGMTTPVGPVVHEHPGGYARQIVTKGGRVTQGVRRELDAAERDGEA